ncbi:Cell wall-associated hydrolase, NlpC family [Selenomonas ruminantium]|uniref:Cell wall-associated hydrolase, NlpC family n=1 Tax=Selenomonas ruminantium TaxID=971 RepID=A0A1M6T6W0_SELRU|nr:NlpC/P60 family protein [Selenomonas ruminantium]SHK52589.1 Cell wall-associated hydrolase, NlpC family [Selenomonas ruminantium]
MSNRILHKSALLSLSFILTGQLALASPTLQEGSHGHDVLLLQKKLQSVGYSITSVDGVYGTETERAVAEFQRDNKIRITGVVNNATWRALKNAKKVKWGVDIKKSQPQSKARTPQGPMAPNNAPILARSKVGDILRTARSYIGVPYSFGGTTPKAFDCSGYLQYVFAQNGINIPRTADEQYKLGLRTSSSKQLVPGDLVFFTTYEPGASHCGIYLGDGEFIHASSSKGVRVDALSDDYWAPRFLGGKHIVK